MTSKAEKLRRKRSVSKAGRPRKENADRYPSGKIKPQWTEQEARAVVIEARKRVHGFDPAKNVPMDLTGSTAGRMVFDGKLTPREREAGELYAAIFTEFSMRKLGVKPTVQAQNLRRVGGHDGEETASEQSKAVAITLKAMRLNKAIIGLPRPGTVRETIRAVFIEDNDVMRGLTGEPLRMLKRGLTAVADEFHLPNQADVATVIPA